MISDTFDLGAYLARIGYAGPREPSVAALRVVISRHAGTIPFENIDVFLGRGVRLDSDALQCKMLRDRRGAYCYEQNLLLHGALGALGFEATGLMARVIRGLPDTAMTPRTHMLLRVELPEGAYLADVGYGSLTPTAPLRLSTGQEEEHTPHEVYRLMPAGDEFLLQASFAGAWANVYRFSLQPQFPIDYEVANWFNSTCPGGLFVENLVVTRPGDRCRMTLFNRRFAVRHLDGRVDRRLLHDVDDYRACSPKRSAWH